ncbi:hypothetical protein [Frankia sp. CiP3]|uniref:hypothetical protein n=1 Tax=Frankia sp. CiP3 TaxID=2880971 RepID=UPI001EF597C0|nr:hypothetical protein [Frankia sp. CiP3]
MMVTVRVCPECGERAVAAAPRSTAPAGQTVAAWSHIDGQPLCPVIGPSGYQPAAPVVPTEIGPTLAGCWLKGSAVRTDDELSAAIIALAVDLGMATTDDDRAILDAWATITPAPGSGSRRAAEDLSEALWALACDAVDHLGSLTVDGVSFELDDGLTLILAEDHDAA